ncbi:MAG TPA: MerR family transcriptional regulator [Fibrobacteria bacterium]|nr:MerR family transcriptional regulator [Fibrobacteria bacterium]
MNRVLQRLEEGKLYYSISEVSRMTGLEAHVLRYWETEFSQMRPRKNRAGNRAYRPREIQYIHYIRHLLHEEKYTLQGAKKKLADVTFEEVSGQTSLLGKPGGSPSPAKAATKAAAKASPEKASAAPAVPDARPADPEPASQPALLPEKRQELEAIRDELKDVLNLLKP